MPINVVSIANSTLATLGANTINSLSDTSVEARTINTKWDIVRRDLLRSHPWNFAVKRRTIAATVLPPDHTYDYQFTLPAESLRLLTAYGIRKYRLEGRNILTNEVDNPNEPQIDIKYVSDMEDVAEWDASFTNVMVYRLALELAYTLPGKNTMVEQMAALYQNFLDLAKGTDASEDVEDELDAALPPMIAVRF